MDFAYHVYILKCADGHFCLGCTNDLVERLARHSKGLVRSIKEKLPVACIAAFGFVDKHKAFAFEKYLKTGSGLAFMGRHLV